VKIPIVGTVIDERFLNHRLKSTSIAGIVGACVAIGLFEYRYFFNHVLSWDLLAVACTFVVVKLAVLSWYRLTD
jgi:protein-S-isoprenylcysteine O-methyltransferase Ste14